MIEIAGKVAGFSTNSVGATMGITLAIVDSVRFGGGSVIETADKWTGFSINRLGALADTVVILVVADTVVI